MKNLFFVLLVFVPLLLTAQCDGVELAGLPAQSCQWQQLNPVAKFPKGYPQNVDIQWAVSGGEQVEKVDLDKKQARITPTTFLGELTITLVVSSEGCIGKANTPTGPQIISQRIQIQANPKVHVTPLEACLIENCSFFNLFEALPESARGNVSGFWNSKEAALNQVENQKIKNSGSFSSDKSMTLFARVTFSEACFSIVPIDIKVMPPPAGLEDEILLNTKGEVSEKLIVEKLGLRGPVSLSFHETKGAAWNPQPSNSIQEIRNASFMTVTDPRSRCLSVLKIQTLP